MRVDGMASRLGDGLRMKRVAITLVPDKRYSRYRVPYDESFLKEMKSAISVGCREWSPGYRAWHIDDSEVMTIGALLLEYFDEFEVVIHGAHFPLMPPDQGMREFAFGALIGQLIHCVIGVDSEQAQIQRVEDLLGAPPTRQYGPRRKPRKRSKRRAAERPPTAESGGDAYEGAPNGADDVSDSVEKYERLLERARKLQLAAKKYRARSRNLQVNLHTLVTLIYDAQRIIERGGDQIEWRWQTILDTCSRLSIDPAMNIPPPPSSSTRSSRAHAVLCVNADAPPEVIDAAYKALAKLHHPDRGGDPERMKEITEAYREMKG